MSDTRSVSAIDDSNSRDFWSRRHHQQLTDWQVDEAENADRAQTLVNETAYDYLLVDFNMPGMNGLDLGEKLRAQFPGATIALLTANIQQEIQKQAERIGLDFLAKPPTEHKIRDYIATKEAAR